MTWRIECADALEFVATLDVKSIDAVVTDPPYPNFWQDLYGYKLRLLDFLATLSCRQFVFWTIKADFPLSFSARHIWHKQTGTYATEEYIYERNGGHDEYRFSYQKIKNKIDAQMNRDVLTGHPSQKPIRLIRAILSSFDVGTTIFDPFCGSGTTGVACIQTGRNFIGCDIEPSYVAIARKRCEEAAMQLRLL